MSGRFVWHELLTSDIPGAIAFYTEVIGWKTQEWPLVGSKPYLMFVGSQGPLGGVNTLPAEARAVGVPPHWTGTVLVDDVDDSVAQVKSMGGKVVVPTVTLEEIGRFATIVDPFGAALTLFAPDGEMEPHDLTRHAEFSWNELYTLDIDAAFEFYGPLFGWQKLEARDLGAAGRYVHFGQGDDTYGGVMKTTPSMPMPPSWVYYVNVDDLTGAIDRVTARRGKLVFGPMDVPGGGSIAMFLDPQGALFALHGPITA